MLRRFCLYGFLKNQQYYDPFLVLAFLQMGLSYTLIGVLIAFREVVLNLSEIPTGAVADLFGRRKSMIFSFAMMGTTGLVASGDIEADLKASDVWRHLSCKRLSAAHSGNHRFHWRRRCSLASRWRMSRSQLYSSAPCISRLRAEARRRG